MQNLNYVQELVDKLGKSDVGNWWPQHLDESTWVEHTPFAAWLMETVRPKVFVELGTHRAVSYMAFCQAARRMSEPTRCFAIDTWRGEACVQTHDDLVFERVEALNSEKYAEFSTLIRSISSDALDFFQEKSIDLLHIDGFRAYEAVSADFNSWLPKMSNTGIILIYGIGARQGDFGAWKLWREVIEGRPSFSFSHGYGLGALAVGQDIPTPIKCLFDCDRNSSELRALREVFVSFGARVATSYHARRKAASRQAISDSTRRIPLTGAHSRTALLLADATTKSNILEIGPLHSPIADKRSGWNTKIVDHATREKLVEKYQDDKNVDKSRIEDVDFVWHSEKLHEIIPEDLHGTFDLLIASHVIEHFPDPVGVLKSAETLLRPDTGLISLAVPDKRLCFDFFRPLSTTGKMLAAYQESRVRHLRADLFDSGTYPARIGEHYAWGWNDTSTVQPMKALSETYRSFLQSVGRSDQEYQDCHAWMFTPASFELLILELSALGIIDWHVQSTIPMHSVEFIVHLARGRPIFPSEEAFEARRTALLHEIQKDAFKQAMFFCGFKEWNSSLLDMMKRL